MIIIQAEFLLEFKDKSDWIRRCPECLPIKQDWEEWIWVDQNGNILRSGVDFDASTQLGTFPVKVFKLIRSSEVIKKMKR